MSVRLFKSRLCTYAKLRHLNSHVFPQEMVIFGVLSGQIGKNHFLPFDANSIISYHRKVDFYDGDRQIEAISDDA